MLCGTDGVAVRDGASRHKQVREDNGVSAIPPTQIGQADRPSCFAIGSNEPDDSGLCAGSEEIDVRTKEAPRPS
jgi:hypothetical protein